MIDHVVCAKLFRLGEFRLASGGGNDAAAVQFRDLDGGRSDAARGRQDQDILAQLQPRPAHQHVPGSKKNQWHRGRLFKAQIVGDLDGGPLGRGQQLGVATVHTVAKDGVPAAEVVPARHALIALAAA